MKINRDLINNKGRSKHFALLPLSFALISLSALAFAQGEPKSAPSQTVTKTTVGTASVAAPAAPRAETNDILVQIDNALTATVRRICGMIVSIEGRIDPNETRQYVRATFPFALIQALPDPDPESNSDKRSLTLKITGSGFVVRGGYVVTTAEVASPMKEPIIVFADTRRAKATLLRQDAWANVAVYKVDGLNPDLGVSWAPSDQVQAGNLAITVGSQAGYSHSAALGMVAGTGRAGQSGSMRYENLIQFQGSVGADNSGGPLFNARGELIGMIVATSASAGQRQQFATRQGARIVVEIPDTPFANLTTVGFAMPSNEVRSVVEGLIANKEPMHRSGWMGVIFNFPEMNKPDMRPVIQAVYEGSPAYLAGLRPHDIVIEINHRKVMTIGELRASFGAYRPDELVEFKLERDSKTLLLKGKTIVRPDEETIQKMKVIGEKLTEVVQTKEDKAG